MVLAAAKVERCQGRRLSADIRVIRGKEFAESPSARNTENIGLHLKSIFAEGELAQNSVVKESFTTAADGKKYSTRFYNLDAIISVGSRVKSERTEGVTSEWR